MNKRINFFIHVHAHTYNTFKDVKGLKAFVGTSVRPQLFSDKRFNLRNPINVSESISDRSLSDNTLKIECTLRALAINVSKVKWRDIVYSSLQPRANIYTDIMLAQNREEIKQIAPLLICVYLQLF